MERRWGDAAEPEQQVRLKFEQEMSLLSTAGKLAYPYGIKELSPLQRFAVKTLSGGNISVLIYRVIAIVAIIFQLSKVVDR